VANIAALLLAFCAALLFALCADVVVVVETIKDATKIFSNRVLVNIFSFDLVFEASGVGYRGGMGMRFRVLSSALPIKGKGVVKLCGFSKKTARALV
jgi:hypothetical protein